ncbi:hypothetical protein LSAT2_020737 [Lamellibrachia satsuma]|nr:hypothetical protein LSAT2_020737 [Lamellibrachia satsuma]
MANVRVTELYAMCAILVLSVAETEAEKTIQCYGKISDVNVQLKCDDRRSVITAITKFKYSRLEGWSSDCDHDSAKDGCEFDLKIKPPLRRLCMGRHECEIRIHNENPGRNPSAQSYQCHPNFKGRVIVEVHYECKETEEDDPRVTTEKTTQREQRTHPPRPSRKTPRVYTSVQLASTKSTHRTSRKTVTLPVDIGDTTTVVMGRTRLDDNVERQASADSTQEGANNTGMIVGGVVGLLVLCVGAAIAFVLFRRRRNNDLKMWPWTVSTQKTAHSYEVPYTTEHAYEEAPPNTNVYEELPPNGHIYEDPPLSEPRSPPMPSRTPSNDTHPTASRTPSSDAPPPVPSRSPSTDQEHPYLELIPDDTTVVSP